MNYQLKPIQWINNHCKSPTHEYTITYDNTEKSWIVVYYNKDTKKTHTAFCSSEQEAKEWVENVHIPAKLRHYFNEVKEKI